MNRREFMVMGAAGAVMAGAKTAFPAIVDAKAKHDAPPRNRRPYSGLDWSSVKEVHTTSHGHCTGQKMLDGYLERGLGLITMSNYYPSAPYVPAAKMTQNYYAVHHEHPVMVKGKRVKGPFDWSKIVGGWKDQLPENLRKDIPFKEGAPLFKPLPPGVLEAPNAEHHSFVGSPTHMCCPGSNFASGTFDSHNKYGSHARGYHFGSGEPWRDAIDHMLGGLICPDGGGVTVNHPAWSHLLDSHIQEMLDYDPRVLGIEVYNQTARPYGPYRWSRANCEDYWDRTLSTGRQCFGFFVPDWGVTEGVNVLLVKEKTVEACLQAYRQGNFYGAIKGRGLLRFTSILFDGRNLKVTLDRPAHIQVLSAKGVVKCCGRLADKMEYSVAPAERSGHVFLRVRAYRNDETEEIIFSQPLMLV